jgi:hypothetical protein
MVTMEFGLARRRALRLADIGYKGTRNQHNRVTFGSKMPSEDKKSRGAEIRGFSPFLKHG